MKKLSALLIGLMCLALTLSACAPATVNGNPTSTPGATATPEAAGTATATQAPGATETQQATPTAGGTETPSTGSTETPVPQTPTATAAQTTPTPTQKATPTPTTKPTPTPTTKPTPTPTQKPGYVKYPFKVSNVNSLSYKYTDAEITTPFWLGNVMYNEGITFVKEGASITGKMLFKPTRIISVRDWSLKKTYAEGTDWVWNANTKTISLPAGSTIPYFDTGELQGQGVPGYPTWDAQGRTKIGNALYCVNEFLYGRQLAITYAYNETDYTGPSYTFQGDKLPKTMAKLNAGQPLKIVAYGDSIMAGGDASGGQGRDPRLPTFATLLKNTLEKNYASKITMQNTAVGGTTSTWGLENVTSKVINHSPDLVILAFGQNDSGALSVKASAANAKKMMDKIKASNPNCEFILMGTLMPNPDTGWNNANFYPKLGGELKAFQGTGVAVVDVYAMHDYLLKSKRYADGTGNNVNHPNDFFIRIHAMMLEATLIDYNHQG